MDRILLIVPETQRIYDLRRHVAASPYRWVESRWDGAGAGLAFELTDPPALPASNPDRPTGPLAALAERLSGELGLDVMIVRLSEAHRTRMCAVWTGGALARFRNGELETRGSTGPASPEAWRDDVAAFLARRPPVSGPDPGDIVFQHLEAERRHLSGYFVLFLLFGPTLVGAFVGGRFGHADLGGMSGFGATAVALPLWLWKTGVVRRPTARLWRIGAVFANGVLLLGLARVLNGSSAAAGFGTSGLALTALGLVLGLVDVFRTTDHPVQDDGIPED